MVIKYTTMKYNPPYGSDSNTGAGTVVPLPVAKRDNKPVYRPAVLFWVLVLSVLVLTGCGVQSYVEKDPAVDLNRYKTYAWIDDKDSRKKTGKPYKDFQETRLMKLVEGNLEKNGFVRTRSNPDVLIDYDIMIENELREQSEPVYSRPFIRYYYNPYTRRINRLFYPSRYMGQNSYDVPYRSGTITINMVDNHSKKLIWQGWAETEVTRRQIDPDDLNRIVKSIFRKLDVARK